MTRSAAEPGSGRDLDGLEVVQRLQSPLGAIDQPLVEGVAFGDIEFAADHVTARAGVAVDVDALEIGARALFDRKGHVDAARGGVARTARQRAGKGIAKLGEFRRNLVVALVERGAVELRAGLHVEQAAQFFRIDAVDMAVDGDVAEMIERAFLDRDRSG